MFSRFIKLIFTLSELNQSNLVAFNLQNLVKMKLKEVKDFDFRNI